MKAASQALAAAMQASAGEHPKAAGMGPLPVPVEPKGPPPKAEPEAKAKSKKRRWTNVSLIHCFF